MPLSPAPLLPGTSPLPIPGQRPPDRNALGLGALLATALLVVSLIVGQFAMPRLLYLVPGLQAQAGNNSQNGDASATFQGFVYPWTARESNGGYTTPASLHNMQTEASVFHMNTVIIPVVGDMPQRSASTLHWHHGEQGDKDTLPESDYEAAIKDARKAGLVPILEIQLKQQDELLNPGQESPFYIGHAWWNSNSSIRDENGNSSSSVIALERGFFDNYTDFVVEYAQLSKKYNLPYFIIGSDLVNVTYDGDRTTRQAKPDGIYDEPGTTYSGKCSGRRDCEWRHVVHALRDAAFVTLGGNHDTRTGAGYGGKLIYAASWTGLPDKAAGPEYTHITWWDAVDFIGVNAFFPLSQNAADVGTDTLSNAWHGKGTGLGIQGADADIFGNLQKLADTTQRPVVFTAAGYESQTGSNEAPGNTTKNESDTQEQLNDMQALLQTFTGTPWWAGAFWYDDQPVDQRSSQPDWATSTAWAGTKLENSKPAGKFLARYYRPHTLPCGC